MKTTIAVLATLAVAANAAPACPVSELIRFFPFATHEYTKKCAEESGFQLFPPSHWPTDAEYTKLCIAPSCHKLFETVQAMNPMDCDVTAFGITANPHALCEEYHPKCARLGVPF